MKNDIKSPKLFIYAKYNFNNIEKLSALETFLSYENIEYNLFLENFNEIIKDSEKKSIEFSYFKL
jgi:hypothetical protein